MAQSTFPAPSTAATLQQTYTDPGNNINRTTTLTFPSTVGLVYCRIVRSSDTTISVEGWIPKPTSLVQNNNSGLQNYGTWCQTLFMNSSGTTGTNVYFYY
jgi:hypothetical protein